MTISTAKQTETIEYDEFSLEATETGTSLVAYGQHLVPLDLDGEFELPQLLAQTIDSTDELPGRNSWEKWGRVNRSSQAEAWHHYASDAKFQTLLRDPDKLIATGAKYTAEINVSSFETDPFPVAVSQLFRKRCVTRVWQDAGIKTFIDLHVSGVTRLLVMDGVPREHGLFCTRYKKNDLNGDHLGFEAVVQDHDLVLDHISEDVDPVFVVYGVPDRYQADCEKRGWYWLPVSAKKVGGTD